MAPGREIDVSENRLRNRGRVLDILLRDRTTGQNILWATDSYQKLGRHYKSHNQIHKHQITGTHGNVIQPRAAKSKEEQKHRTKDKAEVFTPLSVVKEMNMAINWAGDNWPATTENWESYINERRLEITCGEAPFIAGRYNPTANTGVVIKPKNRVGFLDNKLQVVSEFVDNKDDWLKYAEDALKSSYGYEWQGDNLLIARENILLTMNDFYKDFCATRLELKTLQNLNDEQLEHFAEIISWNIWQMDGLHYVIPMSCKKTEVKELEISKDQLALQLGIEKRPRKIFVECEGCRTKNPLTHTGIYATSRDWNKGKNGKRFRFVDVVTES